MKLDTNELLQWIGAVFVIIGHTLNAIGPSVYPWNIVSFFWGGLAFTIWAVRIKSKPQMLVNSVALTLIILGIAKSLS